MDRSNATLDQYLLTRSDLAKFGIPASRIATWLSDGWLEQVGVLPQADGDAEPVFAVHDSALQVLLQQQQQEPTQSKVAEDKHAAAATWEMEAQEVVDAISDPLFSEVMQRVAQDLELQAMNSLDLPGAGARQDVLERAAAAAALASLQQTPPLAPVPEQVAEQIAEPAATTDAPDPAGLGADESPAMAAPDSTFFDAADLLAELADDVEIVAAPDEAVQPVLASEVADSAVEQDDPITELELLQAESPLVTSPDSALASSATESAGEAILASDPADSDKDCPELLPPASNALPAFAGESWDGVSDEQDSLVAQPGFSTAADATAFAELFAMPTASQAASDVVDLPAEDDYGFARQSVVDQSAELVEEFSPPTEAPLQEFDTDPDAESAAGAESGSLLLPAQLEQVLDSLRQTVSELAARPTEIAFDLQPLVAAVAENAAVSRSLAESHQQTLRELGSNLATLGQRLERGVALAVHTALVDRSQAVIATPSSVVVRRIAPSTMAIGAIAFLMACWSAVLWWKTGNAQLAVAVLVGANALACCLLLGKRSR